MDKMEIEILAKKARKLVWDHRGEIWPYKQVSKLDCSNPLAVCEIKGIKVEKFDDLGASKFNKGRLPGIYDRGRNLITVNASMSREDQLFTIAHELAHYKMHTGQTQFRDRPRFNDKNYFEKDQIEWEADYFATCFLMDEDLVKEQFNHRFGTYPMRINENLAWKMCDGNPRKILSTEVNSLEREFAVAKYRGFIGERQFPSLADTFQVSVSAMARRIKELRLVSWP